MAIVHVGTRSTIGTNSAMKPGKNAKCHPTSRVRTIPTMTSSASLSGETMPSPKSGNRPICTRSALIATRRAAMTRPRLTILTFVTFTAQSYLKPQCCDRDKCTGGLLTGSHTAAIVELARWRRGFSGARTVPVRSGHEGRAVSKCPSASSASLVLRTGTVRAPALRLRRAALFVECARPRAPHRRNLGRLAINATHSEFRESLRPRTGALRPGFRPFRRSTSALRSNVINSLPPRFGSCGSRGQKPL